MTDNDEIFNKLGKFQQGAKEMRDIHLAFISAFHGGSSMSYLRAIQAEIKYTKEACVCEYCQNRVITLNLRKNFVIEFIPSKIKWNKINRNS